MRPAQLWILLFVGLASASACGGQEKSPLAPQDQERTPAPGHWPQWRGPNRDGVSTETGLLKEWPEGGPKLLWKASGIGDGVSPISVAGGLIFVLGSRDGSEYVTALDGAGQVLWSEPIGLSAPESGFMRIVSQRAPTIDDDRVYAFRAAGVLLCLRSSDGHVLWQKDYLLAFQGRSATFFYFDAPLVDGKNLICTPGGPKGTLVALDKVSGQLVWQSSDLTDRESQAAIIPAEIGGVRQYIVLTYESLAGIATQDGRLLWRMERKGKVVVSAPPVYFDGIIFVTSGYGVGSNAYRITSSGGKFEVEELYETRQLQVQYESVIRLGDHIYGPDSRGLLKCIELRSGKEVWADRGPGRGPIACFEDRLICRSGKGPITLVEATPEGYRERGRFEQPVGSPEVAWSHPVIAGGRLYIRMLDDLFCYDLRGPEYKEGVLPPWNILARVKPTGHVTSARKGPDFPPSRHEVQNDAVFVPTPQDVARRMLQAAKVATDDVVYDLGSGDGRILISAALQGATAVGYEIDPRLVELSRSKVRESGWGSRIRVEAKDLFTADLGPATVITLYLGEANNKRLLPNLEKLKPGVRIVSHAHLLGNDGPKPDSEVNMVSEEDGVEHTIYLWTTPLKRKDGIK